LGRGAVTAADPFARFSDYDFHHWVAVQAQAGTKASVHRLFALHDVAARNAWFAAREARNELAGYREDLSVAHDLANAAGDLALQLRYALMDATLAELASNLKPGLIARFMATGTWTQAHALAWARLARDPQQTLQTVTQALRQAGADERDELAALALDTAAAIADSDNRVLSVADLAEHLPASLLPQALSIVASCDNEGSRSGGLKALARHLPLQLRRQALALIDQFRSSEIALHAELDLAESLPETERSNALAKALERFRALARDGKHGPGNSFIRQTLDRVPLTMLDDFLEVVTGGDDAWTSATIVRRAEQDPEGAAAQIPMLPKWESDRAWLAVAKGYLAKGERKAALQSAELLGRSGDQERIIIAEALLRELPVEQHDRVLRLTRSLDSFRRLYWLRAAVREGGLQPATLRALAAQERDDSARIRVECVVAGNLDEAERDALLARVLDANGHELEDLAPWLSLAQVERALAVLADGEDYNGKSALALRLAQLGAPEQAIAVVNALKQPLESDVGKLVAQIAPDAPAEKLPALRDAVRPSDDALERLLARAALGVAAPSALAAEALTLRYAIDRLTAMVAITAMPAPNKTPLVPPLLTALDQALASHYGDHGPTWLQAMGALGTCMTDTTTLDEVRKLLDRHDINRSWVVRMFAELAAGITSRPQHSLADEALAHAIKVAGADPDALLTLRQALTPAHAETLARWVKARLAEGDAGTEPLVALVSGTKVKLPAALALSAAKALTCVQDVEQRFLGLAGLLTQLPRRVARRIAEAQCAAMAKWSDKPAMLLFGISTLAPFAPATVSRCCGDLDWALLMLCASDSLPWMPPLFEAVPATRRHLPQLLDDLGREEDQELREQVLTLVAGALDVSKAKAMLAHAPHCAALYARLASCGAIDDAVDALQLIDNEVRRVDVIERAAGSLPVAALRPFAETLSVFRASEVLARRAATLGNPALALSLLERLRNSSDWRPAMLDVCRTTPAVALPDLMWLIGDFDDAENRAEARMLLMPRLAARVRRRWLAEALAEGGDLHALSAARRAALIPAYATQLSRMPRTALLGAWRAILQKDAGRREAILDDVRAFAPALCLRFGTDMAAALDAAIVTGAPARWPG
jgi:hypothetical protein